MYILPKKRLKEQVFTQQSLSIRVRVSDSPLQAVLRLKEMMPEKPSVQPGISPCAPQKREQGRSLTDLLEVSLLPPSRPDLVSTAARVSLLKPIKATPRLYSKPCNGSHFTRRKAKVLTAACRPPRSVPLLPPTARTSRPTILPCSIPSTTQASQLFPKHQITSRLWASPLAFLQAGNTLPPGSHRALSLASFAALLKSHHSIWSSSHSIYYYSNPPDAPALFPRGTYHFPT